MAIYPAAIKKLIPAGSNDPRIKARVAILHVADMLGPSLWDFFAHRSGGIESHFYIRLDGTPEQYRDTDYQADANYHANDFAVSIETEGKAAGEWTPAQITAIQELLLWLNDVDGIPLRKVQNWDGSGVGYHIQFGSPGPWTPVSKSCPGPDRIKQFNNVLVPWMSNPTVKDWFDMAEKADLREVVDNAIKASVADIVAAEVKKQIPAIAQAAAKEVLASKVTQNTPSGDSSRVTLATLLRYISLRGQRVEQQLAAQGEQDAGKATGA